MLPRILSLSTIGSLALIVLLVVPANAAPSMSIGSNANYNLSLTINETQSCNASPTLYNRTACGPPIPEYHVYIEDFSVCTTSNNTYANCFFSPANITVLPSYPVVWSNYGQSVHGVASCDSSNSPTSSACPRMDNSGLDSFYGIVNTNGGTFTHTFTTLGVYYYFDPIHPWMHGNVTVSLSAPAPYPPPVVSPPSPLPITLSGSIGWTIVGLDANTAVLNVSHIVRVTLASIPITPATETGSFQQSVDLSTRTETLGTSADLADNILLPLLSSGLTGSSSILTQPTYLYSSANMPTTYTIWWVNGPLAKGSPVQILTGYSSVQGDENVNLPGSLGARSAWIVTSNIAEDLSAVSGSTSSGSSGPVSSSDVNARLALRFDYDKSSDLLLTSSDSGIVTTTSSNVYLAGDLLCGTSGQCITVSSLTTVTSVVTMTVTASLTLSSTNLNLAKRLSGNGQPSSSSTLSTLQNAMFQPFVYGLAGVVAAVAIGAVVWLTRRNVPVGTPAVGAPPQPAVPAPTP